MLTAATSPGAAATAGRAVACLSCLALLIASLALYPVPVWPLALAVVLYSGLLWRWPAAFLLLVPAILPAVDLGMWTGWMMVGEADLFLLATLAVLVVRVPLRPVDLWPPNPARTVILLLVTALLISTAIGLTAPIGGTGHSDNPFLRPDNALRLAKGAAEALVLLPFIRQRQRTQGDVLAWLRWGMVAGLAAVTLEVLAERALFTGVFNFSADYRVVGPFSSMRVGGGHIGAYLAMALPFLIGGGPARRSVLALPAMLMAGIGGGYALIVTYARTAYLAGLAAILVAGLGWLLAGRQRARVSRFALVPVMLIVAGLAAAASSSVMRDRFGQAAGDLLTREANWQAGWATRDRDLVTALFGMGLGTYPRAMLARATVNQPSDFSIARDGDGIYMALRIKTPFYLGQKVGVASAGPVRLTLRFRAIDTKAALGVSLCDKMLVYSDRCRGATVAARAPGGWDAVSVDIPTDGLGRTALSGLLRRPVELSLFDPVKGTTIDIRDIRLTDMSDRELLVNGDFAHGMDRWIFTDDSHVSWRILNQYLMLLFETGLVGLLAILSLSGLAIAGGVRALRRGDPAGAAVMGAMTAFLISGLFDHVLEAPRLTALFLLVCWAGLILWEDPAPDQNRSTSPRG